MRTMLVLVLLLPSPAFGEVTFTLDQCKVLSQMKVNTATICAKHKPRGMTSAAKAQQSAENQPGRAAEAAPSQPSGSKPGGPSGGKPSGPTGGGGTTPGGPSGPSGPTGGRPDNGLPGGKPDNGLPGNGLGPGQGGGGVGDRPIRPVLPDFGRPGRPVRPNNDLPTKPGKPPITTHPSADRAVGNSNGHNHQR